MTTFEKLHLADSLEKLHLIAKQNFKIKNLKFNQITATLNKLFKKSQQNVLDQEVTYLLLDRYLMLYRHLEKMQNDVNFMEIMYGGEVNKVKAQFQELRRSLKERYEEQRSLPIVMEPKKGVPERGAEERVFTDEFITCQELFSALNAKRNILLVDARPETDFEVSKIRVLNCISVPEQCIVAGLSAHMLGKSLAGASQDVWEKRETYDAIVLYDWKTSAEQFPHTKLFKLRSTLVDWDYNRVYKEPPVVLNGGYLELLQAYPSLCTNPLVYLSQNNDELDELLDLDNIVYPSESENKNASVMGVPDEEVDVVPEVLDEEVAGMTRDDLLAQLTRHEEEKMKLMRQCKSEANIGLIAELEKRIVDVNLEIEEIKQTLQEVPSPDELRVSAEPDPLHLKEVIDEQRAKELQKARAYKPAKGGAQPAITRNVPATPVVNRTTKPDVRRGVVRAIRHLGEGLIGLRNLRNTCYMNTIIQCMRTAPSVRRFFCDGVYARSPNTIRSPAAIINETAELFREMWSLDTGFLEPVQFFEKCGKLEATYSLGKHEDCMEFFLFFLNQLCEDSTYKITVQEVMTPKQKAWFNQFEGKNSFFIDTFYHQVRITQTCQYCEKSSSVKFEIESTFMLSVPDRDFSLADLMEEYMEDYQIEEYCCSQCKKPVLNKKEISYEPKVVVVVLKRYKQVHTRGRYDVKKVESKVHFSESDFVVGSSRYYLTGVALHSGSVDCGHYTAAARTPAGWCEFNDEVVRPINIQDDVYKVKACAFFYSIYLEKESGATVIR